MTPFVLFAASSALATPGGGAFDLVASVEVEHSREAAIEVAASRFNWMVRPIVRARLRPHVWNCESLELLERDDGLRLICDGHQPVDVRHDRESVWAGPDGDAYVVVLTSGSDTRRLTFSGDRGVLTWVYREDGDGLELQTELNAPAIGTPIAWTVRYTRRTQR